MSRYIYLEQHYPPCITEEASCYKKPEAG